MGTRTISGTETAVVVGQPGLTHFIDGYKNEVEGTATDRLVHAYNRFNALETTGSKGRLAVLWLLYTETDWQQAFIDNDIEPDFKSHVDHLLQDVADSIRSDLVNLVLKVLPHIEREQLDVIAFINGSGWSKLRLMNSVYGSIAMDAKPPSQIHNEIMPYLSMVASEPDEHGNGGVTVKDFAKQAHEDGLINTSTGIQLGRGNIETGGVDQSRYILLKELTNKEYKAVMKKLKGLLPDGTL